MKNIYNATFLLRNSDFNTEKITLRFQFEEEKIVEKYGELVNTLMNKANVFLIDDFGQGICIEDIVWFSAFWVDPE